MRWTSKLRMRFQMLRRRREGERIDSELQFHLEQQIAENLAGGMSVEEARYAALRSFGNPAALRDQARETWSWNWPERLAQDFRYALRQMRRSPGFAATVIGTLALGIGAAAAMFTVVDHVLLNPVPYRDPGRLVQVEETGKDGRPYRSPWLDIHEWMAQSHAFTDLAFSTRMSARRNFLIGQTSSMEVAGEAVSANFFRVLGVEPTLGRDFIPEAPSFAAGKNVGTVVLSSAVWKEAFGRDPHILGRVVRINDQPYTVVGVMPPGFHYPMNGILEDRFSQVWVPLQLGEDDKTRDHGGDYSVMARLRPGRTVAEARAELEGIQKRIASEYKLPAVREEHSSVKVQTYADALVGPEVRKGLLALLLAAGVLWLIATVNVTNLLLARSSGRHREIAMRGALGASRGRILQQMIVESLVLSSAAGVLGIGLALGSVKLLGHELARQLPLPAPATADGLVLLVLAGMTVFSALTAAIWPSVIAVRAPIEPALKQGGLQTGTAKRHHRLRGSLVALEVALSLTLLVSCGLLLRTIYSLRRVPLGYRTDHIVVANLDIPTYRYTGQNVAQTLYQPLIERVREIRGVDTAGLMSEVPMGKTFKVMFTLRGKSELAATLKFVSPEIQKIFGLQMLAGRYFSNQDSPTSQPVMIVNPAFAREYAPDKHDPASLIGTTVWSLRKDAPLHVVGILDSERQSSPAEPSQPEIDICLCQITPAAGVYGPSTIAADLALRTDRPMKEMIPELRAILKQASPELANATITTMDQIVEDSYGSQRLAAHLLEIFGGAALLLCVAGLYGLLAYIVTQRTREMGVRIALGAPRARLLWLVMRQAGAMLIAGLILGTALAWASARLVRGFLFGVQAHDGWTMAGAAVLLLVSGLLAAYLPARRAAAVDPMEALRAE
jgi:predicted permease